MKQSESITKLLENFTKAQSEFPTLPKDKNGYNYRYTDLDTVISTVRPILAKYNIGFMQALTTHESGKWAISTRLFNNAGEWIEDTTPLPDVSLAKGNAAQNVGAAITYMKRYTLCAMLGISSDEDPDGKPDGNPDFNDRKQTGNKSEQNKNNTSQPAGGPDTPEQKKRIEELLGSALPNNERMFSAEFCKSIIGLRKTKTADEVIKLLNEEKAERLKKFEAAQTSKAPMTPEQEENYIF